MAGTFDERMKVLSDQVGEGNLVGSVVVDQVYAQYQHEDLSLAHPMGGGAQYLRGPLMEGYNGWLQNLANQLLRGDPVQVMARAMEDLSQGVYNEAPFEFGDLKASPHPTVTDNGSVRYNRLPLVHRLSEDEINIKRQLRALGLGNV